MPVDTERRVDRDFYLLWGSESISRLGSQVTVVAVPLTAVLVLNASAGVLGVITASAWLPVILLGLVAGAWSDRGDRRRTMIMCNAGRGALILSIPLLAALDALSVPALLLVTVAVGCLSVFFDVAYQTFVPSVVSHERLAWANSRLELSRSVAQLIGPPLAGFLVVRFTAPGALTADALSFLLAALLIVMTARDRSPTGNPPEQGGRRLRLRRDLAEGLAFVVRQRPLRAVIVVGVTSNIFIAGIMTLQILFAVRDLRLTPQTLGIAFAAEGCAALLSVLLTTRLIQRCGEHRTVVIGLLGLTCGAACLTSTEDSWAWQGFALAQIAFGLSGPMINVSFVTLRQRLTPSQMLGRVNAIARVCIMCSLPFGALLAGFPADLLTARVLLGLDTAGLAVVLVMAWMSSRTGRAGEPQ